MTPLPDLRPTPSMVLMLVLALAGVLSSTQHLLASAQSPTVGCGIGNTYNLESAGDYLASSTGFVGGDKGIWGLGKLDSAPTNAVINLCTTSETCGNQGLDTQACLYGGPKAIALCAPGAGFSFQFINQSSPSLGAFLSCPPPNNEAAPLIGFVSSVAQHSCPPSHTMTSAHSLCPLLMRVRVCVRPLRAQMRSSRGYGGLRCAVHSTGSSSHTASPRLAWSARELPSGDPRPTSPDHCRRRLLRL